MHRKDLGLLVLILVVGSIVAIRQPLFIAPINIANTANLIGLFGLFAIGQGFVIITGGIELSVGSIIALLGVLFVDLVVTYGMPWPVAVLLMLPSCMTAMRSLTPMTSSMSLEIIRMATPASASRRSIS